MESATLTLKPKWVGNSLAFFVPAEVRDELGLKQNEEVVVHIHKKAHRARKELLSLFGSLKGKNITWKCEEDRHDPDIE